MSVSEIDIKMDNETWKVKQTVDGKCDHWLNYSDKDRDVISLIF